MNANRFYPALCGRAAFLSLLFAATSSIVYAQQAIVFSNPGDYLEIPHDTSLATPEFTHEFWLQVHALGPEEEAGGEQTVMDRRGGNDTGYNVRLAGTEWPVALISFHGPDEDWVHVPGGLSQDMWTHVAITQSADTAKMYVDGELVDFRQSDYDHRSTWPLRIGDLLAAPGFSLRLRGSLDEVRIWDHERPADSIKAHVHMPVSPSIPGLQMYLDFETVDADTVRDLSPFGNNAIVFGSDFVESTAPVDYVPPPVPYSLRAFGGEGQIDLVWKSYGPEVDRYQIHRGDSANFVPDASSAIAVVRAPDTTYVDDAVEDGRFYYYRLRTKDVDDHTSQPGHVAASRTTILDDEYLVGAHYDAVWAHPEDKGTHWLDRYMRQYLVPPQLPMLGEYSSRDPEVIRQHLAWMEEYGIDFILPNWWSRWSVTGLTVKDYLLPELANSSIKFAIMMRTARLGGSNPIDDADQDTLLTVFTYYAEHIFDHPNYLEIDGKKVVFLNAMALMFGEFEDAFAAVRDSMSTLGYELYLVGDDVRFDPIDDTHMGFLDAVYQYSPFVLDQHFGYAVENDYLANVSTLSARWSEMGSRHDVTFVPSVIPGYNQRYGDSGFMAIPRQVQAGAESTSLLDNYIRTMRPFVDPELRMILINSWNRWGSDDQIEPVAPSTSTNVDVSTEGDFYSQGFTYVGDGMEPLEVVRELLAAELFVGVEDEMPADRAIRLTSYPNPFRNRLQIEINFRDRADVSLEIYDVLGRLVDTIARGELGPGPERFVWNGRNLASGPYFLKAAVGDDTMTMTVVKISGVGR